MYNAGIEQSQKPEPFCSLSILTFHDAIDLFLGLSLEFLSHQLTNLPKERDKIYFMDYWKYVPQLSQKLSMQGLNEARVSFKHGSNIPGKLTVEINRDRATQFFEEHTRKIFGVEFKDISLIEMVQCDETKKHLREAEQMLEQGKIEEAVTNAALGFVKLIDDYENRKRGEFGRSPFFFGESMTFLGSSFVVGSRLGPFQKLADFVDRTKDSIEALQDAAKILSLGIDYRRYSRFRLLTPRISRIPGGNYHPHNAHWGSRGSPTADDVRFCINFVIESAVILQDFDYSLK